MLETESNKCREPSSSRFWFRRKRSRFQSLHLTAADSFSHHERVHGNYTNATLTCQRSSAVGSSCQEIVGAAFDLTWKLSWDFLGTFDSDNITFGSYITYSCDLMKVVLVGVVNLHSHSRPCYHSYTAAVAFTPTTRGRYTPNTSGRSRPPPLERRANVFYERLFRQLNVFLLKRLFFSVFCLKVKNCVFI